MLAAGDSVFTVEIRALEPVRTVATKVAIGSSTARLLQPNEPVTVRLRFDGTTRADILEAIPDVRRADGYTVEVRASTMADAYKLIRLMYRHVNW